MSVYFFIGSKLGDNCVMDVYKARKDDGTRVIFFPRWASSKDNQLWKKDIVDDTTFYLVSKLGPRLAIQVRNVVVSL